MDRKTGCVKWFNSRKGYGFITCGAEDIFVHHSALACSSGFRALSPGEYVEFNLSPIANKTTTMAADVTGISRGHLMCEARPPKRHSNT